MKKIELLEQIMEEKELIYREAMAAYKKALDDYSTELNNPGKDIVVSQTLIEEATDNLTRN